MVWTLRLPVIPVVRAAPGGAILKRSAADKTLFEKEARTVVFSSLQDLSERVDDPNLDIHADDIMVLQNAGPTGNNNN